MMSRPLRIIRLIANLRSVFRALFLLLALAACTEPQPELPFPGSYQVEAPAEYESWWQDIERCSGLTRPGGVTYFVTDANSFDVDGVRSIGAYQFIARRMTITRQRMLDPGTVRHEMLHAVLPPSYSHLPAEEHPDAYFKDRCGAWIDL